LNDYLGFILGIVIALALIITKYIATKVALYKSPYETKDKAIIGSMISRGAGAAVVAALPLSYAIPGTNSFIDIVFAVIFVTIFINSLMISIINKQKYKEEEKK
jgi:Sodium/hydrogen exchanger family.